MTIGIENESARSNHVGRGSALAVVRHSRALCLFVLALAGCAVDANDSAGTESSQTAPKDPNASARNGAGPTNSGNGSGPEEGAPPCDEKETAALQATLDGSHDVKASDVVLSVKTPSCGVRFFSSGPSKVEASTLHRIASNTKTYVGSLILELYAEGLLSLSDPASKWFEGVPGGDAIHVEHLLWHTSGLTPYEETLTFQGGAAAHRKWKPTDLAALSLNAKTKFAPGTSWEYANVNYTMLGVIAEKVSGKTLATLLRERIFEKIGATATFSDGDEPFVGKLAVGRDKNGRDVSNSVDPSTFWAAGHLVGTPGDLVTWTEQRGSGAFHDAKANEQFKKLIDWKPARAGWKYGPGTIELDGSVTSGGGPGYGHGGDLPGYHSMAFYFPDKRVTVVEVHDHDYATAEELRRPFFATLKTLFGGN